MAHKVYMKRQLQVVLLNQSSQMSYIRHTLSFAYIFIIIILVVRFLEDDSLTLSIFHSIWISIFHPSVSSSISSPYLSTLYRFFEFHNLFFIFIATQSNSILISPSFLPESSFFMSNICFSSRKEDWYQLSWQNELISTVWSRLKLKLIFPLSWRTGGRPATAVHRRNTNQSNIWQERNPLPRASSLPQDVLCISTDSSVLYIYCDQCYVGLYSYTGQPEWKIRETNRIHGDVYDNNAECCLHYRHPCSQ